jgi:hypothetical protein
VPVVVTVRGETVLLLSVQRMPLPPLPAVAVILREPPHCVPPPPIVGTAGTAFTVAVTATRADVQPVEVLRAWA